MEVLPIAEDPLISLIQTVPKLINNMDNGHNNVINKAEDIFPAPNVNRFLGSYNQIINLH